MVVDSRIYGRECIERVISSISSTAALMAFIVAISSLFVYEIGNSAAGLDSAVLRSWSYFFFRLQLMERKPTDGKMPKWPVQYVGESHCDKSR
jgi:hypothetical protein